MMNLGPFPDVAGYSDAARLDSADVLASFRDRFVFSDPDLIYLDGNSLGRMPKAAAATIDAVANTQWGERLIRSWNEGWWELQLRLGDLIAPLLGAGPGEVIVSDSTSVNLYKLASSALEARPGRPKIVTDDLNFPTDVYVLKGLAARSGYELEIVPSRNGYGPFEGLAKAIDEDTALVSLSHTVFKSGYTYDLNQVTNLAHDAGSLVLWDCSHSVGVVPIDFAGANVDLGVGCTYKYLNGGPGSPAWLYVRSDLQETLTNPITAWWGHVSPFDFDLEFEPVRGIRRFHTGTMPILSLAAIEPGIASTREAGIGAIREKSIALSEYLVDQIETHLSHLGFSVASPADPLLRGSHISIAHEDAWPITRALIELANVVPDFRTPDNLRFGLAPLYNTFLEVHTAVQRLRVLVETNAHRAYMGVTAPVT